MNLPKSSATLVILTLVISLPSAQGAILTVPLKANDLIYDANSNTIYASVPSSAGVPNGNSIVPIDPITGAIGTPIFVGSEPNKLALSDNGKYLYVGLDGAAQVRRVDLQSNTADIQFSLGSDSFLGPMYVEDIEVVPGSPHSVAVSRKFLGVSPRHAGVAIYDDGTRRASTTATHTGSNVIDFGTSPSTLYGYNNETTDFGFRRMSVTAGGVTTTNTFASVITGFGLDIEVAGGIAYATSGRAINPDTGAILGTFNTSGVIEPDTTTGRMYVLSSSNVIVPFGLTNFVPLGGNLAVPGVSGSTSSLIRFESDGLAFRSSGGQVFLIHDSALVPLPEPGSLVLSTLGVFFLSVHRKRVHIA